MTTGLRIAEDLELPVEAVTETFAILAKRGKGKTNTAVVMAEEMIGAGHPVVMIDPVGVWHGIRSSADGQSEGLPVVIFGGDHGDVPLEPTAGDVVADFVVDQRVPAVLDLSLLSKTVSRSLMTKFIERLYHRNRDALHVIVDEADAFAPQRAQADGARLLGAMEDLVRRGRARGIGVTLITQRPAVLHKDVLTQAEVLVALGMTGPRDVAAIDEWVRLHADEDQARDLKKSLPSLPVGTAWVWSPGWLDLLQRVQIRARRTFDSSATPKPGETRRTPKARAELDLTALGEQIAATVEKAKADDPKHLRARIRELEQRLAAEQAKPSPDPEVKYVEVPVLDPADAERIHSALQPLYELLSHELPVITGALSVLSSADSRFRPGHLELPKAGKQGQPTTRSSAPRAHQASSTTGRAPVARPATHREQDPPAARETRPAAAGVPLGKAERLILTALAQHGPRTVNQVATLTAYSSKGGGFRNALSALRSAGRIVGTGTIEITDQGLTALGDFDPLPTGSALLDWWKAHPRIGKAEALILDALAEAWPTTLTVDEIAARTDYSAAGGGFRNALSRLRTLELASGRGELVIAEELID